MRSAACPQHSAARLHANLLNARCRRRAVSGRQLDVALADCHASLALKESAAALDSRAFVYMRLGRIEEAIADYDAALKLRPAQASSLFRRGIVKLRKGATEDGQADLSAARAIDPRIDAQFADYGVKL